MLTVLGIRLITDSDIEHILKRDARGINKYIHIDRPTDRLTNAVPATKITPSESRKIAPSVIGPGRNVDRGFFLDKYGSFSLNLTTSDAYLGLVLKEKQHDDALWSKIEKNKNKIAL